MIRLRKQSEMACRELVELVTDYLEDALSRRDRRRFEAHLAGCPHCTLYLEQFRETIALTGTLREEDISPSGVTLVRGAVYALTNRRAVTASRTTCDTSVTGPGPGPWLRGPTLGPAVYDCNLAQARLRQPGFQPGCSR